MTTLVARPVNTGWFLRLFGGLKEGVRLFSAAHECAVAVEAHRCPPTEALRTLGIDEKALRGIYKRR
ncbi:hypothetical protein ACUSIJ_05990 [Pseudochelatococcus sp. B33]